MRVVLMLAEDVVLSEEQLNVEYCTQASRIQIYFRQKHDLKIRDCRSNVLKTVDPQNLNR